MRTDFTRKRFGVGPGDVVLGKYSIGRLLGAGGMGGVFEAKHLGLEESVAVKLLAVEFAKEEEFVERFVREARTMFRLKNEHVGRIFDVGQLESGIPFMVMELLDGQNLARFIDENELLDVPVVIEIMQQVCEAMAEAHGLGIVHRDLKPENVFVTYKPNGTLHVKVLDFGLTKALWGNTGTGRKDDLTRSLDVVGSPRFMPPEQVRSLRDADERSDVWALGAILYRMLTKAYVLDGPSQAVIFAAMARRAAIAPPRTLRPDLPAAVDALVMRCLAWEPANRYASAGELAKALEEALTAAAPLIDTVRVIGGTRRDPPPEPAALLATAPGVTTSPLHGASSPRVVVGGLLATGTHAPPSRRRAWGYGVAAAVSIGASVAGLAWARGLTRPPDSASPPPSDPTSSRETSAPRERLDAGARTDVDPQPSASSTASSLVTALPASLDAGAKPSPPSTFARPPPIPMQQKLKEKNW